MRPPFKRVSALALATVGSFLFACSAPAGLEQARPWTALLEGSELAPWVSIPYGGEGEVWLDSEQVLLPRGVGLTGIQLPQGLPLTMNYELQLNATRVMGNDFFCGLTFPVGDEFATLIVGGWGGGLCGLSCVDGKDASQNETKSILYLENDREYSVVLRVEPERIRAWLDERLLVDLDTRGKQLSLRTEMLPSTPLSISSYITSSAIGRVRWRPLMGGCVLASPKTLPSSPGQASRRTWGKGDSRATE